MATAASIGPEIVERVASLEGVDPLNLDSRLYDAINVDALDALTKDSVNEREYANFRMEFDYHGYVVTVDGAGEITIDEQAPDIGPADTADDGTAGS